MITLSEIDFIHSSFRPRCNHVVDKLHDYHVLCMTTRGRVALSIDGVDQVVTPPGIWYCSPGSRIAYRAMDGTWTHRHVAFRGKRADAWIEDGLVGLSPLALNQDGERHLLGHFDNLLRAYDSAGPWADRYRINLLENLLIAALELREAPSRSRHLKEMIRRWFMEGGFQNPDVADWADRLGYGESTFRRVFSNEVGQSLHQFCMALRVEEASFLLSQSELSQEQIAENCGYCNVHHLSRAFKAAMGMTPGVYRKGLSLSGGS